MNTDERRAWTLFQQDKKLYNHPDTFTWQDLELEDQEIYRSLARAIRESDEAAGLVLVRREATEKMAAAWNQYREINLRREDGETEYLREVAKADWRAMIAASEAE